jgi:hypothetical protein
MYQKTAIIGLPETGIYHLERANVGLLTSTSCAIRKNKVFKIQIA